MFFLSFCISHGTQAHMEAYRRIRPPAHSNNSILRRQPFWLISTAHFYLSFAFPVPGADGPASEHSAACSFWCTFSLISFLAPPFGPWILPLVFTFLDIGVPAVAFDVARAPVGAGLLGFLWQSSASRGSGTVKNEQTSTSWRVGMRTTTKDLSPLAANLTYIVAVRPPSAFFLLFPCSRKQSPVGSAGRFLELSFHFPFLVYIVACPPRRHLALVFNRTTSVNLLLLVFASPFSPYQRLLLRPSPRDLRKSFPAHTADLRGNIPNGL
ncbi:uncharacterized protein K452DRAFT_25684 [Aplosporella prunicola CBS 121167]|uniref:Uncharacterized protein n=1 Tax=Aplosporella prunicola CBS 121167 TaxID=1176127 RepID=A0A6A6BES6_9PEZI|nr:uncharacterized protein K452DRAFT_25684 [Aplosporella prunicola CBS 121167]KAF2142048.1 hypothetical protein K452DRAFT_25684 [Aplosporella prunicola CBS 121167]